eukprot:Nk52_evm9s1271 gene=Nk52_evmTU9s1271
MQEKRGTVVQLVWMVGNGGGRDCPCGARKTLENERAEIRKLNLRIGHCVGEITGSKESLAQEVEKMKLALEQAVSDRDEALARAGLLEVQVRVLKEREVEWANSQWETAASHHALLSKLSITHAREMFIKKQQVAVREQELEKLKGELGMTEHELGVKERMLGTKEQELKKLKAGRAKGIASKEARMERELENIRNEHQLTSAKLEASHKERIVLLEAQLEAQREASQRLAKTLETLRSSSSNGNGFIAPLDVSLSSRRKFWRNKLCNSVTGVLDDTEMATPSSKPDEEATQFLDLEPGAKKNVFRIGKGKSTLKDFPMEAAILESYPRFEGQPHFPKVFSALDFTAIKENMKKSAEDRNRYDLYKRGEAVWENIIRILQMGVVYRLKGDFESMDKAMSDSLLIAHHHLSLNAFQRSKMCAVWCCGPAEVLKAEYQLEEELYGLPTAFHVKKENSSLQQKEANEVGSTTNALKSAIASLQQTQRTANKFKGNHRGKGKNRWKRQRNSGT